MSNLLTDEQFDELLAATFAEPEPPVPTGLCARMSAWTSVELEAQREAQRQNPARPSMGSLGLLPPAASSWRAFAVSLFANVAVAAFVVVVVGASHFLPKANRSVATLYVPPTPRAEVPKPPPPSRLIPPTPNAQPRVDHPLVEPVPDMKALPVLARHIDLPAPTPATAIHVEAPPAPRAVSLGSPLPSMAHPTAKAAPVALGRFDSPARATPGPAVSHVNLAAGSPAAAPSANASAVTGLGVSQPADKAFGRTAGVVSIAAQSSAPIDPGNHGGKAATAVEIAPMAKTALPSLRVEAIPSLAKPPVVTYIPTPAYTAEAKTLHLQGDVQLNVRFLPNGTVQVLGVAHGLGHGLDESAQAAARLIQFRPATDTHGDPIEFTTIVRVHFVLN